MYIMSGNIPVVEYDQEYNYKIINHDLAPIYIKNRGDIRKWISDRALSTERANSRAIKAVMGLSRTASDYMAAMKMDAATITDNFWVKDEKDERTYEDIVFSMNEFFALALYRDVSCLDIKASRTPELTNIGQQEKGWKLEDGKWWLYKNEPVEQIISEYITYKMGVEMGFDMAEYDIVEDGKFIRTKDFTEGKYNLQHIDGIMIEHTDEAGQYVSDEDYSYNYHTLANLSAGSDLSEQYLNICTLDALCENYDRHTKNYGVLTDQKTGEIISLAPNYDNNNTLLANYNIRPDRTGGVMRMYTEFLESEKLNVRIKEIPEKRIEGIIEETFEKADYHNDKQLDLLKEILSKGVDRLKDYIEKEQPKFIIKNPEARH